MSEIPIIFYNPGCSKCRMAKEALLKVCADTIVVQYLDGKLNTKTLKEILRLSGKKPLELIRRNEKVFIDKFSARELSDDEWMAAIIQHPILLERPIVIYGDKAMVTRDEASLKRVTDALGDGENKG